MGKEEGLAEKNRENWRGAWRGEYGRLSSAGRFGGLTECLISGVLGEYRRFGPASRGDREN